VRIYQTQATAFSANDAGAVYSNLVLRRMEVYDTGSKTGECFYLGCNNDACQVRDSLVELNYCHDTATAQEGYGSGIQLKTGSYRTLFPHTHTHTRDFWPFFDWIGWLFTLVILRKHHQGQCYLQHWCSWHSDLR
jgi:hypothetical protein